MRIQTIHTKHLRWIDVVNPGPEELAWLKAGYKFHKLHFQAAAKAQLRPHLDVADAYNFLVLLFPVYDRETQEIFAGEVDFFIGDKFLVTIHYGQIETLKSFFEQVRTDPTARGEIMPKGAGFLLYKILEVLFQRSYPILDHVNEDVAVIESKIFRDADVDMLSRLLLLKKNIIEVRKMMKTHNFVIEQLGNSKKSYMTFTGSKVYYRDLVESSHNIWDILEALKETVDTLAETSQSLASHRLNQITKMISIMSAIVIPATLTAFIFAVDVPGIPFQDHPHGFWIVAILMALSSLSMLAFFKAKKWF